MSGREIVLVGGGHAHVAVLADWIRHGRPAQATLLTPHPALRYSGMVPGWIAGEYERGEGLVDLAALAERAGVELVLDRCVAIAPDRRVVATQGGHEIAFDIASVDTGGVGRARDVLGDDPCVIDIRPIEAFVARFAALARSDRSPEHIAVVGGGAGGVELAFALRNSPRFAGAPEIMLVAGAEGLLPTLAPAVARRVRAELDRQGIRLVEEDVQRIDNILTVQGKPIDFADCIVAALGSAAPEWPRASGLACDPDGFIAVDRYQRSTSHPHIHAAGDVAARTDRDVGHSGVHAVHAGPVLARNLRSAVTGQSPEEVYTPRLASLYLLSTGNGGAIASYGPFAMQGRWVGKLKRRIDRRWMERYAHLAHPSGTGHS